MGWESVGHDDGRGACELQCRGGRSERLVRRAIRADAAGDV